MIRYLVCLAGLALTASTADAAPPALPECGSTVRVTGDFAMWRAPQVHCPQDRPVIYDVADARITTAVIRNAEGLVLRNGLVDAVQPDGKDLEGPAVTIDGSRFILISGMTVTRARIGIAIARSSDIVVDGNNLVGLRSDGVNVGQSQRVKINHNVMMDFHPIRGIFDAKGKLLKDGDHSDGVQVFSLPGQPAITDLEVSGNLIIGEAQGINNFGDAGTISRVQVTDNTIIIAAWHGITFGGGSDIVIRNNTILTMPGAKAGNYPFQPLRAWLKVAGGQNVTACGNTVPAFPNGQGVKRC